MARQRQRARDRKRRAQNNPGPAPTEPQRENIPGPLEHASGDQEEFEAAIISGAGGVPVDEDGDAADAFGGPAPDAEEAFGEPREPEVTRGGDRSGAPETVPAPGAPTGSGGARFITFLRASWAELQRVQWPDRRQVAQATGVVLGFVILAGAYLGLADALAQKIVDFIL